MRSGRKIFTVTLIFAAWLAALAGIYAWVDAEQARQVADAPKGQETMPKGSH